MKDVVITRGISALDKRRNYALHKATELIRADPAAGSWSVEKTKKDRTVTVGGTVVYSQKNRYDPDGEFVSTFRHLHIE